MSNIYFNKDLLKLFVSDKEAKSIWFGNKILWPMKKFSINDTILRLQLSNDDTNYYFYNNDILVGYLDTNFDWHPVNEVE